MAEQHYTSLRSANLARHREWAGAVEIPATFRSTELAGEVGEACNIVKKLERERLGIAGSRTSLDKLAEELADVVICADLLAMHYGIDLVSATQSKFNQTSIERGFKTRLQVKA
jgi:NTP pyrophosphatase (non-canonical NTP hydrolase)